MARKAQIFKILMAVAGAFTLMLTYFFADAHHWLFFPRCPFFMITGLWCPGCGCQRSFSALLHGDFSQAVRFNALLMASLPFLLYLTAVSVMNVFGAKMVIQKNLCSPWSIKIIFIIIVVFAIVRNIAVWPFNLLKA